MYKVKFGEAMKVGWDLFTTRPWFLMGLFLLYFVTLIFGTGEAVFAVLTILAYAGLLTILLKFYHERKVELDDMFSFDQRWISLTFLMVVKTIFIMLGFICFVIPGIYLAVRWMFAELLVMDEGMKPMAALKASSALTAGNRWALFFYGLLATLIVVLGALLFIVGMFAMAVVVTFAFIKIYYDMKEKLKAVENTNIEETV